MIGLLSFGYFALNTLFWGVGVFLFIPVKLLLPEGRWRRRVTGLMVGFGENWIAMNGFGLDMVHRIRWEITGDEGLRADRSYLVIANHRSWVDIVVLQKVFNRRIPFLRFFLKRPLIYVPVLGAAWWALDFPFMRRYSREYLERHPEKRFDDAKAVRAACRRFQGAPTSILNFLEGTRFTPAKRERGNSAFRHLLTPKAGGVAFVIESMGEQFEAVLDVTIHYPGGSPSLWDLLSGRVRRVIVRVRRLPVPRHLIGGNYLESPNTREAAQAWVREIWQDKDRFLDSVYI